MRGLIVLSVLGLGGVFWALLSQERTADLPVGSGPATIAELGPTRDYQVVAHVHTAVELAADRSVEAHLELRGALIVTPVERVAEGMRVELRWRPRTLTWTGLGATADSAATQAALARHPVRATWRDDGRVVDFSYPSTAPGAVASLTETLLGELALPLEDGLPLQTGFGVAQTRVVARGGAHLVERSGADYVQLEGVPPDLAHAAVQGEGVGRIQVDRLGLVESTFRETLHIEEAGTRRWATRFEGSLRRAAVRQTPPPIAWQGVPRARLLGAAERRALEGRVGDLTPARLLAQLDEYALGGRLPKHHRAVWRAAGLLKLQPERCADLVPIYQRDDMSPQGKALLLDILVATGHAHAQGAMRTMLASDDQTTRDFGMHLQRFSQIRHPEPESVDFLEALAQTDDSPHLRRSAQATLGAAAAHLQASDPARAQEIGAQLAHRLTQAEDPAETGAALLALGNTRLAEHAPAIAARLDAPDVDVRLAAADALADMHTPAAQKGLINALFDTSPSVRQMALVRLADQPLSADAITDLGAALATAPLHPAGLRTAAQTLSILQESHGAQALQPAYDALLGRADLGRRIRNQLRRPGG